MIASSTGISRTALTRTLSIQSLEKERERRWLDSGMGFSPSVLGGKPAITNDWQDRNRNVRRFIFRSAPGRSAGLYSHDPFRLPHNRKTPNPRWSPLPSHD